MATSISREVAKRLVEDVAERNLYLTDEEKEHIAPSLRRKIEKGIEHFHSTVGLTVITYDIPVPPRGIAHISEASS